MEKKVCKYCNKVFSIEESSKKSFCSKTCQYKFSHQKAAKTLNKVFSFSNKRKCLNCSKEFIPTTGSKVKTCSTKCGYEYRSKTSQKPIKLYKKCIVCGKEFKDPSYGITKTCSKDCALESRRRTNIERYGVPNAMQNSIVKNKLQKNNIKRIGTPTFAQSKLSLYIRNILSSKEELEDLYIKQDLTISEIAAQLQVSDFCIGSYLKKHHIPVREWKKSHMQKKLAEWIKSLGFDILIDKKSILPSKKEIDIYIPSKKIAIEFNGLFWHSEKYLRKNRHQDPKVYHLNKTKDAESVDIHLVHIYEDDWRDKQDIVKNRLLQILGKTTDRIFARSCEIREVSFGEASVFLNEYHIQGSCNSKVQLGLYYHEQLVAVMTFGSLRKALGQSSSSREWELLRFVSKGTVVGGASKLLKHFIDKYHPKQIISYADRDWTTDIQPNLYNRIGFIKVDDGSPGYWYIINGTREHRFNWRKSELPKKLDIFDPDKSEYQNMLDNGYDRIWGCGSFKYLWTKEKAI